MPFNQPPPYFSKPQNLKPSSTGFLKQIYVYLVSFFLPPLGLWFGFKYLRENDEKAKKIGLIAILLTIISLVLTVWASMTFVNNMTQSLKEETEFYNLEY